VSLNFQTWEDFNNISVKVKIGKKNYSAILLKKNNYLIMRIDMLKDIEFWRNDTKDYPILNGNLLYGNQKITFLNCQCVRHSCSGVKEITEATLDYRIDRIILGKKLTKEEYKNISHYEVEYNNIDCFTNNKPYSTNYKTLEYKGNLNSYDIKLDNMQISMIFTCSEEIGDNLFAIKRKTFVIFNHNKKINIASVLDNIYMFRNFLMILLKKAIIVEKQYIFLGNEKYCLFDCRNDVLIDIGKDLEEHLNHRCLKIEEIKNISEICQKFYNKYNELHPLIELYYNVTQFSVPNLTRFVNAITMLEYFSRTFDFKAALLMTQNNLPKRKDPEYKCMVASLINNVNSVYGFTQNDIEQISKNIKNARDKYIHYLNKKSTKQLSYDEQFWYSYFMEDIILLNIYNTINLDIKSFEYITFEGFYYEKSDLI